MYPQSPIVAGIEEKVAKDSRSCVVSPVSGKVVYVDSDTIKIKKDIKDSLTLFEGESIHTVNLKKYFRTNQNTVHNQRPLVVEGQLIN